jgi:hypothetical protein
MIEKKGSCQRPHVVAQGKHPTLEGKFESFEATRLAANKKHKGEIDGLKIQEKASLRAASTSSKLVGDASRELIGSKADKIREMRKQISDLSKDVKDSNALQTKVE